MNFADKIAEIENYFNTNFAIELEDSDKLTTDLGFIVGLSTNVEMSDGTLEGYEDFDDDVINDIFDIIENQKLEDDKTWERSQNENW